MVDGVVALQNDLRDGEESVAVFQQGSDDARQSFGGVLGGVVEQDDGAGLDFGGHPLGDLRGGEILPIQAVYVSLYSSKRAGWRG